MAMWLEHLKEIMMDLRWVHEKVATSLEPCLVTMMASMSSASWSEHLKATMMVLTSSAS